MGDCQSGFFISAECFLLCSFFVLFFRAAFSHRLSRRRGGSLHLDRAAFSHFGWRERPVPPRSFDAALAARRIAPLRRDSPSSPVSVASLDLPPSECLPRTPRPRYAWRSGAARRSAAVHYFPNGSNDFSATWFRERRAIELFFVRDASSFPALDKSRKPLNSMTFFARSALRFMGAIVRCRFVLKQLAPWARLEDKGDRDHSA